MSSQAKIRNFADRPYCIGGFDSRFIMGDGQTILSRLWCEKRRDVEREGLADNLPISPGLATAQLNRRWYQGITGRMPAGSYVLAVCYATAVVYLASLPWSVLLILLLLPRRNERLGFHEFETCKRGSSL
jgi:hypothetical protein